MNDLDVRLFRLPDRMEIADNMDVKTRAPLSSMQLWEIDGRPVIVEQTGRSRILYEHGWGSMDAWELISDGMPMSFMMFEAKWPGLVTVEDYIASFRGADKGE